MHTQHADKIVVVLVALQLVIASNVACVCAYLAYGDADISWERFMMLVGGAPSIETIGRRVATHGRRRDRSSC